MVVYRFLRGLVKLTFFAVLLVVGAYGVFSLWDNGQILEETENLQEEILQWKPQLQTEQGLSGEISFAQLQAVNPDVCGWVTLQGTNIDLPIVQGKTNLQYLNTDFYGKDCLAGSVFLDCRNEKTFQDPFNLLYGHHMERSRMFGDLDKYRDPEFFRSSGGGKLITPRGVYALQIYGVLVVPVSDPVVFDPQACGETPGETACYLQKNARLYRPGPRTEKTLVLSTCASDFPDARTVVLADMVKWQGGAEHEA